MLQIIKNLKQPYISSSYQKRILLVLNIMLTYVLMISIESITRTPWVYPLFRELQQSIRIDIILAVTVVTWFLIVRPLPWIKKIQWFVIRKAASLKKEKVEISLDEDPIIKVNQSEKETQNQKDGSFKISR